MNAIGMRYCEKKANYYVDGHERPDNVSYQWEYVKRYLKDELQMHRWVQMTIADSISIKKTCPLEEVTFGTGWKYVDSRTGEEMVEYHVDAIHRCSDEIKRWNLIASEFGGI